MLASRVDEETSILRSWRRMPGGYDAISKRVNASYAETGDIRETMRELRDYPWMSYGKWSGMLTTLRLRWLKTE